MSRTDTNQNAVEDEFSLTVDQYGRLWLHTKLNGLPVDIDLAEKDVAFEIMAETMAANDFRYVPTQLHEAPVNDDERT